MKIAHLILAHKNPAQLQRLLRALAHPQCSFFIHVDAKADQQAFQVAARQFAVHFIKNRVNVQWGTYSLVQAELNGIREIVDTQKYDYINVLSAQDFPLKSADFIYRFFVDNAGAEFITCTAYTPEDEWWNEAVPRVWQYNFHNWRIPGKYRLQFLANLVLPRRTYPLKGHTIVGRSQWFSITAASAAYMIGFLDSHPQVVRYFRYVWGADEFIFSTVIYNSPFREKIRENLVYTDWSEKKPNPKLLTTADFESLRQSDKLFARKFDIDVDGKIIDMLEEMVLLFPKKDRGHEHL